MVDEEANVSIFFATAGYVLFPLMLSSFAVISKSIFTNRLPRIVHHQLFFLLTIISLPHWLFDILQILPISFAAKKLINSYTFLYLSNIFMITAAYYSVRKMMGLRFLNMRDHVHESPKFDFIDEFRGILHRLSRVKNEIELSAAVQDFFRTGLHIEPHKVYFYIRPMKYRRFELDDQKNKRLAGSPQVVMDRMIENIESFLKHHSYEVAEFIERHKVLIYDEVTFDNFYYPNTACSQVIQFLNNTALDVFVPIYTKGTLTACIAIERDARSTVKKPFYTDIERDQMLVFTTYLVNIIHLMYQKNVDYLLQKENELRSELHQKTLEVEHYRECVQSFSRAGRQHKAIGIMFYKNRYFAFGNSTAQELVMCDPNIHYGHPITQHLRQLVAQVETSHASFSIHSKDGDENDIILHGAPSNERNHIIITIYYPDVSDILKRHNTSMTDPSDWDFFLYLETTKHGRLINRIIPGSGRIIVDFKIKLLKLALSKKPVLLYNVANADESAIIELIHSISLRDTLHFLNVSERVDTIDVLVKLFGLSSVFTPNTPSAPLLSELDKHGTLVIQNVHYLPLQVQEHIAEFVRLGAFRSFKGEELTTADVRIICSVNQDPQELLQNNLLSPALFDELAQTAITTPSLQLFSEGEFRALSVDFGLQEINNKALKNLLELNEREKNRLSTDRPSSLLTLKARVKDIIAQKAAKKELTTIDPIQVEINAIAVRGKKALKDKTAMAFLWKTFGNQNQIAALLNVNRSSVNRRCKEFNLI